MNQLISYIRITVWKLQEFVIGQMISSCDKVMDLIEDILNITIITCSLSQAFFIKQSFRKRQNTKHNMIERDRHTFAKCL